MKLCTTNKSKKTSAQQWKTRNKATTIWKKLQHRETNNNGKLQAHRNLARSDKQQQKTWHNRQTTTTDEKLGTGVGNKNLAQKKKVDCVKNKLVPEANLQWAPRKALEQ
jgi:hypothetical protein